MGSRELGSRLYQPDVLVFAMVALRQARTARDDLLHGIDDTGALIC